MVVIPMVQTMLTVELAMNPTFSHRLQWKLLHAQPEPSAVKYPSDSTLAKSALSL
jgi:hypothetical protein